MPFWRRRRDDDLDEEIQTHLRMAARERADRGQPLDDAVHAARHEFGNVGLVKEATREMWGWTSVERLAQDVRYGLRLMRRSPGFTIVAVLSLALGIGANTAIFSLINVVRLKPLPVSQPDRLVFFTMVSPRNSDATFSYPAYEEYRGLTDTFAGVIASAGMAQMRMTVTEGASVEADPVRTEKVSGNFFSVLGVNAAAGRMLADADDRAGEPVAVISHGLWQRRFGLDRSVVGRRVVLDTAPFTIVGVAPAGFFGCEVGRRPDVWIPFRADPRFGPANAQTRDRGWTWLRLMGRLQRGVTVAQARAAADAPFQQEQAARLERRTANGRPPTPAERTGILASRIELYSGRSGWTELRSQFQQPLLIVLTVVGLVLLVACANVANLLLARASARRKEIAVRAALGAGRLRLLRQILTESAMLAGTGGVLGLILARWIAAALLAYVPDRSLTWDLDPDVRILAFTTFISLLTGMLFGLAPALRATKLTLTPALKEPATPGASRLTLNKMLVVSQVACSLFLLIGAGLFVRTLQNLRNVDLGFSPERVTLFSLRPGNSYDGARRQMLFRQVLERLEALPGVQSSSLSLFGLLSGDGYGQKVLIQGYTPRPDDDMRCSGTIVGPKFFETMGIAVLRGRGFDARDTQAPAGAPASPRVAIVNETMARAFFAGTDPIGRRFATPAQPNDPFEVVGVVKDSKYRTLREQTPRAFYLPFFQTAGAPGATFEVRSATLAGLSEAIRQTIRAIDPGLHMTDTRTMSDVVDQSLIEERLLVQVSSAFGLFALLLASIGLYGVMAYSVARRSSEIGVRMALGASERAVLWLVAREALSMVIVGIAIGVPIALALTRLASRFLFGLSPTDPSTIVSATLVLLTAAVLAAYLPARRAARVDPMVALRCE